MKNKTEPKVAMVVLTYTQKKMLGETLSSLYKKTNYKNYKVYVMDNGSVDRHDKFVLKNFKKARAIRSPKNLGFSKGNNFGSKIALSEQNPDYLILLNDDLEFIDKDWLKKAIEYGEKNKKVGVMGCHLIYPDGSFQDVGGHLRKWELTKILKFKEGSILDVDHFMGACVIIKREVIDKIGLLDEIYSPFLLEDSDFCLRAKEAGYSVKVLTNVKIIHKKSKTVGRYPNYKHLFVRFKNDVIFSARHLSLKNALFRIFIFLPLVAILKKKKDQEELNNLNNYGLRKEFLINILLLLGAYAYSIYNIPRALFRRFN